MTTRSLRLMIPGPVQAEDEVLAALAEPILPHYGEPWMEIYRETIERLKQVFGTREDLLLMAGPGTAGLDAALGSLTRTGEKVLVLDNGFFGRRLGTVAEAYGLEVGIVQAPMDRPIDPQAVRQFLEHERDVQAVAAVHLETSSGVLNPLQEIAAVTNDLGIPIVVDAVSSMGGTPLPVDKWGIDVCVTVCNKCLACPPGVAPMSVSQRAWDQVDRKGGRAHGWYLNLSTWKDYAVRWPWHPYPITLPTNNIVALLTSLRRILDMGLEAYYERHVQAAQVVRTGLRRLGFQMFTAEAYASPLLTAVYGLPGMDIDDFRRYLLEEWQVMIAGGLDELQGKIFRVGHMGKAASVEYAEWFLDGVEAYLRLKGHQVPPRERSG
jgi:alanine-glyoxylate transaminase/serine-glyoxylate transaminase/serine-pyruvate transaminase